MVGLFFGETQRYEAVDENGIAFTIARDNSRSFTCVRGAEGRKQQAEREARDREQCKAIN